MREEEKVTLNKVVMDWLIEKGSFEQEVKDSAKQITKLRQSRHKKQPVEM